MKIIAYYITAKKGKNNVIINKPKITNYYDCFINTINIYKHFVNKCNNIIKNTNKNIYIFGACYNTQL